MKRILTVAVLLASVLAGSHAFAQDYQDVWNDVRKPWRANSEINAAVAQDSAACETVAGEQYGGPSRAFIRCMAAKHWKLAGVVRLRSRRAVEPEDEPTTPIDTGTRRPDDVFPDSPVPADAVVVSPGQ